MNKKEAFMSALRNDKPPKWMGHAFDAQTNEVAFGPGGPELLFHAVIDPISNWDTLQFSGECYKDLWGVTNRYIIGVDPGIIPLTDTKNQVIKDMEHWRDYVKFPEIPKDLDWSYAQAQCKAARERGELIMIPSFRGLFERLHCLRAFECVMEDLMLYPDECVEFFEAYTDWKLEAFKLLIDNLDFDIMHSHDDLGAKTKLFFSPQIYRDMLKPNYKRLYDYCHSRGILVQHHCDCFIEPFAIDFAEIGIDMWQGALPTNDIVKIQKELDEKGLNMLMMGGLEAAIVDNELATEEEIRAEVRRAIDTYGPGGHFLPCIGSINCLYEKNEVIAIDEMNRYGAEWIKKQQA
ncbi:MAG: uroporphyrinogen decarboxylase (URO-D) [Clostridiales bacterium]|nr:uroporphyrinogen decarboxylase (URO-D) [Clostridiales bacterium]